MNGDATLATSSLSTLCVLIHAGDFPDGLVLFESVSSDDVYKLRDPGDIQSDDSA
jgi:hypothetical protein